MPWWAHEMAVEGLLWEKPWLPGQVEMVENVDRSDVEPENVYDPEATPGPGVFVGVRPEEVVR